MALARAARADSAPRRWACSPEEKSRSGSVQGWSSPCQAGCCSIGNKLLAVPEPIEPRLFLAGLFRLLPQGPTMQLCVTGQRLPVALEGDYRRLLQAYRSAVPAGGSGQPLLVNLKGLISQRSATQPGQGPRRALVVEAFGRAHPGQGCPQPQMALTPMASSVTSQKSVSKGVGASPGSNLQSQSS